MRSRTPSPRNALPPDGILCLNKPRGWTSFDVVAFVRKRSGVRRVGHAGTLDPAAEGVLPVCLGQATRVVEYLMDARKTYVGQVRFGATTDTYDGDGRVLQERDASHVSAAVIEAALQAFRGEIEQRPPAFSALKREGVPLYRLARAGTPVAAAPRRVVVHRLELRQWQPPVATLEIDCGKGTYVRSLAHDLGEALGVGAYLEGLVRTGVGPFTLERAVSPDDLGREFESGAWRDRLIALDEVLLDRPALLLGDERTRAALHGRAFDGTAATSGGERVRAYSAGGDFLAVVRAAEGRWLPEKVFVARPVSF